MKVNLQQKLHSVLLLIALIILPLLASSQEESKYNLNSDRFSVGLSTGPTLFWGDIASSNKSSIYGGLHINSRVTPYLSNSLTIYRGKMKGQKEKFEDGAVANLGFENDFWQIDRIYRFYPLSHPKLKVDLPVSPYIFGGLGIINYKSYYYDTQTNKIQNWVGYSREAFKRSPYRNDLILPFGLGFEFPFKNIVTFFAEHKIVYAHSDLLDAYQGNKTKKNDWYSFTSFGVNLNIDNVVKGVPTHKITKLFGESLTDKLTFGISVGNLSFWGDGNQRTVNPIPRMFDYRKRNTGGGIHIEKEYTDKLHLRFSAIFGQLMGIRYTWSNGNPANFYFKSKFSSFDISQKYFFISNPDKIFSMYASAGLGIISYRSASYDLKTDNLLRYYGYKNEQLDKAAKKIDPIVPVSLGIDLNFKYGISVFVEQNWTYCHTDYLDAWKGRGSYVNDFFSYTNFGVKYSIFNKERSFYN